MTLNLSQLHVRNLFGSEITLLLRGVTHADEEERERNVVEGGEEPVGSEGLALLAAFPQL